jgi:D-sedoheptulose 7-phosphate isomerase
MADVERAAARVRRILDAAIAAHQRALGVEEAVARAADAIRVAVSRGGKVLVFGNGGSAADAQHMVAEMVGRFQRERKGMAALALTTDTSTLTSVANDYGFERIFERQVEALGREGDVAFAISTSGGSPNVVAALKSAKAKGLATIALTGRDGGEAGRLADLHVNVAETVTARVQEVHRTLIHAICELVEET